MNMFMELCLAALLAVAAENVIFTGGIGFSRVLRAARKPKTIALYSCFVGLFSLASALTACYLGPVLLSNSTLLFMRPAVYAFCAALAYLLVAFVLKTFLPKIYGKGRSFRPLRSTASCCRCRICSAVLLCAHMRRQDSRLGQA